MGNNKSTQQREAAAKKGHEAIDYSIRAPYDPNDKRYVKSFTLSPSLIAHMIRLADTSYKYDKVMAEGEKCTAPPPIPPLSEDDITLCHEILQFYNNYGFVIFDNCLPTEQERERSIIDLWKALPHSPGTVSMNDPKTWYHLNHPFSFVGESPFLDSDLLQLWKNRCHPHIYTAFKLLYSLTTIGTLPTPYSGGEKDPLIACFDRGSIMPPVKGDHGRMEWQSNRVPHFDMNPFLWTNTVPPEMYPRDDEKYIAYEDYRLLLSEGNNTTPIPVPMSCVNTDSSSSDTPVYYPKLRAVLTFSDSTSDKGGFECVTGFHRYIHTWCSENIPKNSKSRMSGYGWGVDTGGPLDRNMQRITMRPGSMVIFSAELPHTMYPNESDSFRYAQYIRMTPLSTLDMTEEIRVKRNNMMHPLIPKELDRTDVCKEVFML